MRRKIIKRSTTKVKKNHFGILPPEIALKVLTNLSPTDILQVGCVNKKFEQLCQVSSLWKKKFKEAGIKGLLFFGHSA